MDYKVLVKEENLWASEEEIENVPSVIKTEYSYLKEAVFNDDVCGALFRLKDIYEICMKIPAIMAIISISSYVESDNDFIRMTNEQLKQEYERYLENDSNVFEESEVFKKFGQILSNLLLKPLAIGSWRNLIEIIVENSTVFELEEKLQSILSRTIVLHSANPKKVGSQNERYENVATWRNKTIGHGTLLIDSEQYWEQVYDLVKGLYIYFIGDTGESSLSSLYERIQIVQDGNDFILQVGEKRIPVSEYVYKLDEEQFFFDSYFSKQNYTEVTNYFSASKRLKNSTYFQKLFSLVSATEKRGGKKKRRLITNSADREMYACLNPVPQYEKPVFIIKEIRNFLKDNSKGVMYIQMERGMGKSVLAHKLDGRYQNGILQNDLNAVTRVYQISDMQLRGERRTSDFFTALNSNLLSYYGADLEIDNEEYIYEGKDVRHMEQMESDEAQIAFSYYLELFREHYEYELYGEDEGEEIKLVYIIDGIDELNSDTESILDVIPSHSVLQSISDEIANHVYVILLSRTKEEERLPEVAKRCIGVAEEKAGMIFKVDSENEEYLSLLRKFVKNNYKSVPEEKVAEIIDYAERKFLYIQPYMALGNKVLAGNEKNSAYSVAQKYVEELQKLYCGSSLHTLQLVIAAIAVFHSVSLKELCDLVLFTKVSYDVIGILNDILPLLSVRRTDGDDAYEFANEEYEQYVYTYFYDSVCEAISRFRISLISWYDHVDKHNEAYGKQWGEFVKRLLHVDYLAKEIGFTETTEEYVKCLLSVGAAGSPGTYYSEDVDEELRINTITQLEYLKFGELKILTLDDLMPTFSNYLEFRVCENWTNELNRRKSEYTQGIISHCIEFGKIDIWFETLFSRRLSLCSDLDFYDKAILSAFRIIVKHWKNQNEIVDYFVKKIKEDYENERYSSYGIYLEELLFIVDMKELGVNVYEGLLFAYKMLANNVSINSKMCHIESNRRKIMLDNLQRIETVTDELRHEWVQEIRNCLSDEYIYEKNITQLENLVCQISLLNAQDYLRMFFASQLSEEKLTELQLDKYYSTLRKNYFAILDYLNNLFDEKKLDEIFMWLSNFFPGMIPYCYSYDEVLVGFLNIFCDVINSFVKVKKIKAVRILAGNYKGFLSIYDKYCRESSIGLYGNSRDGIVKDEQKMTSWERTYALYGSSFENVNLSHISAEIPIIANNFTNKYLQELFDDNEFDEYYSLNRKIEQGYLQIDIINNYILDRKFWYFMLIRNYYKWLCVRYYRSLEGRDESSSDDLFRRLSKEFECISEDVARSMKNSNELIHKSDMFSYVIYLVREMLCLAKMLPDSIISIEQAKSMILDNLEQIKNEDTSQIVNKKIVDRFASKIDDPSEWYNSEMPFVVKNTTIIESLKRPSEYNQ